MKNNVAKRIANAIDQNIPDTNVEEAKKSAKNIGAYTEGAVLCGVTMMFFVGFAVEEAAELSVKGTKTLIKKAGIKVKEFYEDRPEMMVTK